MPSCLKSLGDVGLSTWALGRAGLLGPHRPDHAWGYVRALSRWGLTLGATYAMAAARAASTAAVIDDDGAVSFAEMDARTSTVAACLADMGIGPRDQVGVLCRNHRGFLTAVVALGKLGADTVYLNTGFAGPQMSQVAEREGVKALILDEEFLEAAGDLRGRIQLIVADAGAAGRNRPAGPPPASPPGARSRSRNPTPARGLSPGEPLPTMAAMLGAGARPGPPAPGRVGGQIILTSGTTGAPKGAQRSFRTRNAEPLVALLSKIPLHTGDTTFIAAPMFHSWGLANLAFGLVLGSTLVLTRRFDPEETLRRVERHRVRTLIAVPVMIQRIMELPRSVRRRFDTSSLRVVALSGSALPGELAGRFMDEFGDVLYNMYGSTEIGWASIAGPGELRAAPGTAGKPPLGTEIRLYDADGNRLPGTRPGRIFVRNGVHFQGYTGGGGKDVIDGFMATGDVGHFDGRGRLFVDGRDDDMIVSGGENVFPREVEDLLLHHPSVNDAAVIGVDDERYGQRLKAFVVRKPRSRVSAAQLKDHVRAHLARYKVPREVVFVDSLPRNATGKVVKRELG